MSPLNKKLLRDLVAHWTQVATIVVVIALGIIMFSGPLLAQRDLRGSIDTIYRRTRYEDFSVKVELAPKGSVAQLAGLDNIKAVDGRLVQESLARVRNTDMTVRVISVPDDGRSPVNRLLLEAGRFLEKGEGGACLAEHHLTAEFKLKPGDKVTLQRDGNSIPLRIAGSAVSPEYLRLVGGGSDYVADPAQFGVIFVNYSEAERIFNIKDRVNNYCARVFETRKLGRTMESAGALLEPYGVTGLTKGSDEPSAVTLNLDIDNIGKIALFFSILLLAVASLALYITMTEIVFSDQREIGITRAVGYSKRNIMSHYIGYGLVQGVIGGFAGVVLGFYLSKVFINIYADIFSLPLVTTSMYWAIAAAGLGVALAFSILGAVIPARHAVRMKPAEAMRTEAGVSLHIARGRQKPGPRLFLIFPSWLRISFRDLIRNRRRTLLTCLGVIATLSLLVTATGGKDSLDYTVVKYLGGVLKWDMAAVFSEPVGPDTLEKVRGIDGVIAPEPAIDIPARLTKAGSSVDLQVQAYPADTALHGDFPVSGSHAQPGAGEIILNRGTRKKLPVKKGDDVIVSTGLGSLSFKVGGFVSEPFGGVAYVNLRYVQALFKTDRFNVVLFKVSPGKRASVAAALRALPLASQVITKSGILRVFEELVGAIKTLFVIFYVMAFAMGFAILFSMITVNTLERRREIATIRTLGAGRSRIFSFLTVETVTVVAVAMVPGILVGRLLEWFVIERLLTSDRLAPDAVISGATLIFIIVASLAVMVLSEVPSIGRLWRLDLARVTKERFD